MKRIIRNVKTQYIKSSALLAYRKYIKFFKENTNSFSGENILQWDSGLKEGHILMLSAEKNL